MVLINRIIETIHKIAITRFKLYDIIFLFTSTIDIKGKKIKNIHYAGFDYFARIKKLILQLKIYLNLKCILIGEIICILNKNVCS